MNLMPAQFAAAPVVADLYELAADSCKSGGLYMEFGVYCGHSLRKLRQVMPGDARLYGFDSFDGLPEPWTVYPKGTFATGFRVTLPNTELVVGTFEATLPAFVAEHPGPVSLMHIDCDLYASTKTVLEIFRDRLVAGSVILFDELVGYAGYEQHEYRALREADLKFEVLGRWNAYRAAIQIR